MKSAFPDQRRGPESQTQIFLPLPVPEIVSALIPVLCIIGYLISVIAVFCKNRSRDPVNFPVLVFARQRRKPAFSGAFPAFSIPCVKRSSFFYNKTVRGDMLRSQLCTVCPGTAEMRSIFTLSNPLSRTSFHVSINSRNVWIRPSSFSSRSLTD